MPVPRITVWHHEACRGQTVISRDGFFYFSHTLLRINFMAILNRYDTLQEKESVIPFVCLSVFMFTLEDGLDHVSSSKKNFAVIQV